MLGKTTRDIRRQFGDQDRWPNDVNVHRIERVASIALGAAGVLLGVVRRGWLGAGLATLGGALVHRGVTGHSELYRLLRISTAYGVRGPLASVPHGRGIKVKHAVTVRQPPELVYGFWRRLENLPKFMRHLESVVVLDDRHSHWRVKGPADMSITWDAEVINEVPGELIAWRSLPGSELANAGSVRFVRALGGHGTIVTVSLEYDPPAGVLGTLVSGLLGADPQRQIEEDMTRFKELLEVNLPRPEVTRRGRLNGVEDLETARQVLQADDPSKN